MNMRILFSLLPAILAVGCGSSSSNNALPPAPIYGPALGTGLIPQCVGAQCSYGVPQSTRIGFYAQTNNFQSSIYVNNGSTFTPVSGGMKGIVKDAMGVCDRNYADYGLSNCNSWINGYHDLVFMMDGSSSNSVRIMLRSYPQQSAFYSYAASFPSASQFFGGLLGFPQFNYQGVFNPLILTGTIWPINDSKGFEIRANGPTGSYGYNQLMQLQVAQGKVEDERFTFSLQWNGHQAASGTLVRCQTLTCGLPF